MKNRSNVDKKGTFSILFDIAKINAWNDAVEYVNGNYGAYYR
jgi:hypothetical protein